MDRSENREFLAWRGWVLRTGSASSAASRTRRCLRCFVLRTSWRVHSGAKRSASCHHAWDRVALDVARTYERVVGGSALRLQKSFDTTEKGLADEVRIG